jgi:hypothetical protein
VRFSLIISSSTEIHPLPPVTPVDSSGAARNEVGLDHCFHQGY